MGAAGCLEASEVPCPLQGGAAAPCGTAEALGLLKGWEAAGGGRAGCGVQGHWAACLNPHPTSLPTRTLLAPASPPVGELGHPQEAAPRALTQQDT